MLKLHDRRINYQEADFIQILLGIKRSPIEETDISASTNRRFFQAQHWAFNDKPRN